MNKFSLIYPFLYVIKGLGQIAGIFNRQFLKNIYYLLQGFFSTGYYFDQFKKVGKKTLIFPLRCSLNLNHVEIGNNSCIEKGALIRCYKDKNGTIGNVIIGDNVRIGLNANISSCNRIKIGNGVLTGRNILINDNSHGYTRKKQDLFEDPISRPIYSKGPIIIEDKVWIGENVAILGGVRIGHNSIIGANSVVTKTIPPFCIVGGIPAKIIKSYEKEI